MKTIDINTYALVTGSISGIDRNLVEILAEEGYNLILITRKVEDLKQLSDQLKAKFSVDVVIIKADLSKSEDAFAIHRQIEERKLTVAIVASGVVGQKSINEFIQADLQREMQIIQYNTMSFIVLAKLFLPAMIERKQGKIISIAAGDSGNRMSSVYAASIAFLDSFVSTLKKELEGTGVSIKSIRPTSAVSSVSNVVVKTEKPIVKKLYSWPFMKKRAYRDRYESFMRGDA